MTDKPTPDEVTQAREAAALTKADAARLAQVPWRTWQKWETGEQSMSPGTWALVRARFALASGNPADALAILGESVQAHQS